MSIYQIGILSGEQGSRIVYGENTEWQDPKTNVHAGSILLVFNELCTLSEIYQIQQVISHTELLTIKPLYNSLRKLRYAILLVDAESNIEQLYKQLSITLNYYQVQLAGWQLMCLTNTHRIELITPESKKIYLLSPLEISQSIHHTDITQQEIHTLQQQLQTIQKNLASLGKLAQLDQLTAAEVGALDKNNNLADLTNVETTRANLQLGKLAQLDQLTAAEVGALDKNNNLADLTNVETARANLQLGKLAQLDQLSAAEVGALDKNNNLADLTNVETARANLQLGKLAQLDQLSAAEVGALDKNNNLADLTNVETARTNLQLGKLAQLDQLSATEVGALDKNNNLADLTNVETACANLQLGKLAQLDQLSAAEVGALDKNNNLADLTSVETARTNLQLGKLAQLDQLDANAVNALPISGGTMNGNINYKAPGFAMTINTDAMQRINNNEYYNYIQRCYTRTTNAFVDISFSETIGQYYNYQIAICNNLNNNEWRTFEFRGNGDAVGGRWTTRSDRRLKKDLLPIGNALDKVTKLTGYTFKRLDLAENEQCFAGLVAQEVQQVLPEAISITPDYYDLKNVLSISNNEIIALLVEAIKDLHVEIKLLKHSVAASDKSSIER